MIVIDKVVKIENNEISHDHFIVKYTVNKLKVCDDDDDDHAIRGLFTSGKQQQYIQMTRNWMLKLNGLCNV